MAMGGAPSSAPHALVHLPRSDRSGPLASLASLAGLAAGRLLRLGHRLLGATNGLALRGGFLRGLAGLLHFASHDSFLIFTSVDIGLGGSCLTLRGCVLPGFGFRLVADV